MSKLKRNIRWIIPLICIALIAAYFVLAPMVGAHAAGVVPNVPWGGR